MRRVWWNLVIDLGPAIGLLLVGLLELPGLGLAPDTAQQHLFAVLVSTLALAVRRRHPLAVALAVAATVVATSLGAEPPDEVAVLLAVIVSVFSAAAYLPTLAMAGATAANAAALTVSILTDTSETDASGVGTGMVLFVVLPAAVGAAYRRRRLATQSLEARAEDLERQARGAVAAERRRIAREVHDLVAHSVSVIAVQAEAGKRVLDGGPATADGAFTAIAEASRSALVELARLLRVLREDEEPVAIEPLSPQPGLSDLDALLDRIDAAGLAVRLRVEGEARPLAQGVSLCAYRVIQEALTNTLKHSAADQADVTLGYSRGALDLEVRAAADGSSPPAAGGAGRGLIGMWERVALCGGSLSLDVSNGFAVRARLPLTAEVVP
ncbi:sensor histidine kinase [Planotetraspora thailandica]|uniref:sensor histidine kinase n=1 Tax=Planotetraspora thailandica TaxID=487172 RepID=UPI00194E00BB|nr:histidine kinase [Planotetraspora thailandica]